MWWKALEKWVVFQKWFFGVSKVSNVKTYMDLFKAFLNTFSFRIFIFRKFQLKGLKVGSLGTPWNPNEEFWDTPRRLELTSSNADPPYGGFLKWWYPTTIGPPTKNI